jgi:hypothetical protein
MFFRLIRKPIPAVTSQNINNAIYPSILIQVCNFPLILIICLERETLEMLLSQFPPPHIPVSIFQTSIFLPASPPKFCTHF